MALDAASTIEIANSPGQLWRLCVGTAVATVVCASVAIPLFPNAHPGLSQQIWAYIGFVMCALFTAVFAWRLATSSRGPVITITPYGIRDTRIAADFIPWRAVRSVDTWGYSRYQTMVLSIDPAVERQLQLTVTARVSRGPNRALGADGLCIAPQGLNIEYQALLSLCRNRFNAAHGRTAG